MWSSPEKMQKACDDYFEDCKKNRRAVTVTGLTYHLGFAKTEQLARYAAKPEFEYVVLRAKLRVEMAYEEKLHTGAPTGAIFALKNMGWTDTQNQTITVKPADKMTDDELMQRAAEIREKRTALEPGTV